jgi:multidrug resistance efflux pump
MPTVMSPGQPLRSRRSRRRVVLLAIALLIIAGVIIDRTWIRANGIVAGELTAVSPIVQARLQNISVKCLDRVVRGQRIAEFDNEATVEAAAQQRQQLELQQQQARAQAEIAARQAEAARKLVDAQVAELQQLVAILQAQDELVKKQFVATLAWQNAKSAAARGEAEKAAAEFIYQTKLAERTKAEVDASVLQQRIESFKNAPELTGHFFLTAPKDGIVTECTAHVGEVIPAKTPILQIFNPDDAYAIVFFDPGDIAKLSLGQRLTLNIEGIAGPVAGSIAGFYPELSALPSSLTRYFWQQERWSQYAPVRVDFEGLNAVEKDRLAAWAQLSVSHWQLPAGWGDHYRRWTEVVWGWVQRQFNSARRLMAEAATK